MGREKLEVRKDQQKLTKKGGFNNRLFKIKLLGAVWFGKVLIVFTRILGRGGTTLPGRAALRIEPGLSSALTARLAEGSLVITGTNGKTTTSALITGMLKEAGFSCIHNQSGSNMSWGVASALIGSTSWSAYPVGDCAVMEVDEGAFPGVVKGIKPRGVVVTNIYRDQLDRYGEIDLIKNSIKIGLEVQPTDGFQVINADDPSLVGIADNSKTKRWTYGLELDLPVDQFQTGGRDIKTCPRCHKKLAYDKIYFAHIGHYHCPFCSYKRPEPDVKLVNRTINPDGTALLQISLPGENFELNFPLIGTYNLYNILAAVTCAKALAIPTAFIIKASEKAVPSFGRMELFEFNGKKITMALIKNPVGANEVLRTLLAQKNRIKLLVAINDKIADGTDVSWLWDVDFEQLVAIKDNLSTIIVSGLRAWDMAVRLKYAGFNPDQIKVEEDTAMAIVQTLEQSTPEEMLFILPTYTAMLEIRRHLNKMGLGKPYWED